MATVVSAYCRLVITLYKDVSAVLDDAVAGSWPGIRYASNEKGLHCCSPRRSFERPGRISNPRRPGS
jgi:hypothetical protein